ncbi:MAG: cytochrome P450 [Candidatus Limnocylindrales bacterium]
MPETREPNPRALDAGLTDPGYFQDPYPALDAVREATPLFWSEAWGVWVMARHGDISDVLKQPDRFSNAGRFSAYLDKLPGDAAPYVEPLRRHYASGMLQSDPPAHSRLRPLINKAFTPRVVEGSADRIRAIVDDLIDAFRTQGRADLLRDFAYPLPAIVISELMGVPVQDREMLIGLSDGVVGIQRSGKAVADDHLVRSAESIVELERYFTDLCRERKANPGDDLISALVEAEEAGDRLDEAELISMCSTLLIAGHETTRNLIANGMYLLLSRPDDLSRLRADDSLLASAIEEMLRYESPIQRGWRRVAEDTELHDRQLREGDLVYLMLGAANRDPRVFDEPQRFDIARRPNRHAAFGKGIHFCVGAPLSRLEARIAFPALLVLPGLRLAEGHVRWVESITHRGLESLKVTFDA